MAACGGSLCGQLWCHRIRHHQSGGGGISFRELPVFRWRGSHEIRWDLRGDEQNFVPAEAAAPSAGVSV
jgi:hypothetical protein